MKNRLFCVLGIFFISVFASCTMDHQTDLGPIESEPNTPEPEYPEEPRQTTLTIRNQSFSDLSEVSWNNNVFEENSLEHSINMGRSVTKNVSSGIGYIYFKRDTGAVFARTDEVITVTEGDNIEFTFTDNTIILEKNNTNNKGTLSSLESKIVFFDDAEGELQPYDELKRDVFYYDLSVERYRQPVKNGNYSIAIGGTDDAGITLTIDMKYPGEISFWYATSEYQYSLSRPLLIFSIDEEQKMAVNSCNWSFRTFPVTEGVHTLKWTGGGSDGREYYASLDDIKIVYTE